VLDCELENNRIPHYRSLDLDDPRTEAISPCLCTFPEEIVENCGIVDLDITTFLAFGQRWQNAPIDNLNFEEAVMNRCSCDFVRSISL
jgi:hypothetical protein